MAQVSNLESYFKTFRNNIIGKGLENVFDGSLQKILYADWTASGRLYAPIEQTMSEKIGPWVANTHTETSLTGATMTAAYAKARQVIKQHVNANEDDILILTGTGMTGAKNKLVRLLGLRIPEQLKEFIKIPEEQRPIILISHMEHHSNHTTWLETIGKVMVIPHTKDGLVDLIAFERQLRQLKENRIIVSVTACSNVTGIKTPYHKMAALTHEYGGVCFVDFACSAPYVDIDMHPNEAEYLDAITFSPHKFLGGPGSSGVLIMNKKLYQNKIPDSPGGGTVVFTDPWGNHMYKNNIEEREDGGTPGFLQGIRVALSIKLKEQMGTDAIRQREDEINAIVFSSLENIKGLTILAGQHKSRLSIFSFFIDGLNYDLVVRLLNDKFGIQTRGGCSCAGTYGHYLMHIDKEESRRIMMESVTGCTTNKPGWVRASFHPIMSDQEVKFICKAIASVTQNGQIWKEDYQKAGETYIHKDIEKRPYVPIDIWFEF